MVTTLRRRSVAATIVALCATLAFAGCGDEEGGGEAASNGSGDSYTIGATIALTGVSASAGELWRNGATLAAEEINAEGGIDGRQVDLIVEDTATETSRAVSAYSKLASRDDAPVVVSGSSTAVLAQAPISTRTKTVLLNAAAQSPEIRGVSPYVFSVINDSTTESQDLVAYAADQGVESGIIVFQNDASGEGNGNSLEAAMQENGIEVTAKLQQNKEDKDYRSLVARIKGANPPAVFLASGLEPVGFLLKQSREAGVDTQWYGLSLAFTDAVTEAAGKEGVEGLITIKSNYVLNTGKGQAKDFVDAYEKRFDSDPDEYAAHFYDAIYIIKHAVENGGGDDGEALMQSLAKITPDSPFEGVTGPNGFDEEHTITQPNVILRVSDGELVPVDP